MSRVLCLAAVVAAAAVASARPAHAEPTLTAGVGLGALSIPREDDSFTGGLLTAQAGARLSPRWSALLRASYSSDSIVDAADGSSVELRYLALIPSARLEDDWAWLEVGVGWVHGWRDVSGGMAGQTEHAMGQVVLGARLGTPATLQAEVMVGAMVGEAVAPWAAVGVRH